MKWEDILTPFFYPQLLKIAAAVASWVTAGKDKFCTDMIGLLSPNTTINLC
jgi:hypothetical protein